MNMTDDAEHLLHGTASSSIPLTTQRQCQCQCASTVQESELKLPWCQKTTETPHNGQMRCCHCCCCCPHAKNRSKEDRTATDLLASQENGAKSESVVHETDDEEQSAPFDVEAMVVEYRYKVNNNKDESLNFLPMPAMNEGVDATLRYSYKGIPPEEYSAKKEFIYTRPLVEKQLVLKKTCEWWFFNNKCSDMTKLWKYSLLALVGICLLALFGFIILRSLPIDPQTLQKESILTETITFTTNINTDQYPQLENIDTEYINRSFIGDEKWDSEDDVENDITEEEIDNSIPEEVLHDFVKPRKVHNSTLNVDDLLYESKRNNDNNNKDYLSTFSVTGNFRQESNQIWDPHPEYLLKVFGRELHLVLHQDTSFIPPKTFKVLQILNNRTEKEIDDGEGYYLGCYYKGYVQGDDQSGVAVSLCNGMTGYIKTSFGSLLIQPVNQTNDGEIDLVHKVWRHSRRNARHAVPGTIEFDVSVLEESMLKNLRYRKKRDYDDQNSLTLEVLLAVDNTVRDFHKNGLKSYLLTLVSMVAKIFDDASLGNNILISVAKILVLNQNFSAGQNASDLLRSFCTSLSKLGYHYDTAMLLTRDPICRNSHEQKCDTLGLAEMGTVCKPQSCSIVQDNGLAAAFTIAHELGHILNIPHDDDDRCRNYWNRHKPQELHIMSSIMSDHIHPFSWSACSRHYVSEFLERMDRSCLEDTHTQHSIDSFPVKQPGEVYNLDAQCRLMLGKGSRACLDFSKMDGECKRLFCSSNANQSKCTSRNLPWADGSPCRNSNYWCQRGECVPRIGFTREVQHGGWSAWSQFTACSLSCGGGVQEAVRECNNPIPANGGKFCKGSHKKYRSCNTHSCPPGSLDAREQQCASFNGRNPSITGLNENLLGSRKWIPKYMNGEKICKRLYCRLEGDTAYFPLAEQVKDGTTCSYDTFDKCVNGICRPAGCDNELNSVAKLDRCGICEGRNNTCEEYTGHFYVSNLYDILPKPSRPFYYITTIPKGASNIVITQSGYPLVHYIVLRDDENKSILNGNKGISTYQTTIFYAGVMFEYNGGSSDIERVGSTNSLKLKRDLIVEIISVNHDPNINNNTMLMSYTYTYDKPSYSEPEVEIYRWEMQPWSSCDSLCQGVSQRSAVCISTTMARKMAPQYCDESAQPATEYRNCNKDCQLILNVTSISECSASCGNWGTREKTYNCIQTFLNSGQSNIVDMSYCKAKMEVKYHEPCREGCWDYSEWSQCSATCGAGTQNRSVACFVNRIKVNDSYCNPRKKYLNDVFRICTGNNCRVHNDETMISTRVIPNNWVAGEWSQCNDNCEKTRTVSCNQARGYGCHPDRKPSTRRKCCQIKYVFSWSNCSAECGNGVRQKELHCARVYKAEVQNGKQIPRRRMYIDPSYCRNRVVPRPKRTQKPCSVSCKWSTSDWTRCDADCHEMYQSRSVYCESALGNQIGMHNCDNSKKPESKKVCNNCVRKQSRIISNCNCEGYRRRRIVCYDLSRKRIACPTKEPVIREKCTPPQSCRPKSCMDIRRMRVMAGDGNYIIYVNGVEKKIYCHDMQGSPKEYITVVEGENYSIYYDYKTPNPDKCPPESRRSEYRDTNISSGRTDFQKIRLNITNLRIIENDFTFATTRGVQQPLGSAGDCYNRRLQCPQGDFSININGTGFVIRPGTRWERRGNYVAMKTLQTFETSLTKRRALCGGYCGRCEISHMGMYLDTP